MCIRDRIKAHGLSWRMALATQDVRCRMYRNSAQVFEGFTKNLFAGFGYRVLPFLLIWLWICIVFLQPPIVLALIAAGLLHSTYSVVMAAVGVFLAVLLWGISNARFGFPLYLALLYPVTTVLTLFIAARSVAFAVRGRSTWKGRTCLLYTSDAADERSSVDLGGRRIIKKKKRTEVRGCQIEWRSTTVSTVVTVKRRHSRETERRP